MTLGGAIADLRNLMNADDIPFYYKPSIKKVIETIEMDAKPIINAMWVDTEMVHKTGLIVPARRCTNCGASYVRHFDLPDMEDVEPNFCPNCGADMGLICEVEDE